VEVLLLPVGDELYAVPIHNFREVVAEPRVTRIPVAPPEVMGLVNVRGEIVPLFDAAALLSTGKTATASFAAVVGAGSSAAALATTAAPHSEPLGKRAGASPIPGARGIYRQGDALAILLDVDALLTRLRQ